MAVKHLIGPALVGSGSTKYLVTRGLKTAQNIIPIITVANSILGDVSSEDAFRKGLALTGYTFTLINKSTGVAITSGTVTTKITKDGGTQTSTSNTAAHEGNGQWSINLTASELDADVIGLAFTHANALTLYKTLRTIR